MGFKAVFLDRDGVINKDLGYVSKIDDFDFFEDIFETCLEFKKKGYKIIIVTNQSGIARGYFTEDEFLKLTEWMDWNFIDKGIEIDGIYYCPHHYEHGLGKYKVKCKCRKPEPGMILDAAKEHNINLHHSVLIGDKHSDLLAGHRAGINNLYLIENNKYITKEKELFSKTILNKVSDVLKYL